MLETTCWLENRQKNCFNNNNNLRRNNQRRLSSEPKGSIDEEIVVDEDSNDGKPTSAAVNTTITSLLPKSPNMVIPKSITPISSSSSASSVYKIASIAIYRF